MTDAPNTLFQFQTGSIRRLKSENRLKPMLMSSFNSKLVRLEVLNMVGVHCLPKSSFNSKLVRLEDTLIRLNIGRKVCFNSKLVRLEVLIEAIKTKFISFQFQTGSIRRLSKNYINIILHPYSSCQVNFSFLSDLRQPAVDL